MEGCTVSNLRRFTCTHPIHQLPIWMGRAADDISLISRMVDLADFPLSWTSQHFDIEDHNKPGITMRHWTKNNGKQKINSSWNNTLPNPQLFKHCCAVGCSTRSSLFNGLILFSNKPAPQRWLPQTCWNEPYTEIEMVSVVPFLVATLASEEQTRPMLTPLFLLCSGSFAHVSSSHFGLLDASPAPCEY